MQILFRCVSPAVLGLLMITSFPVQANPIREPKEARQVRIELAVAFSQGDLKAISARVHDGWSGLRFSKEGEAQPELAKALREAEVVSVEEDIVHYKVVTFNKEREVTMSRDGYTKWRIDYNMLAGPFPHM